MFSFCQKTLIVNFLLCRKLYWTDRTYDVLEVANTDGSMRKTLVRENLFEPRGVALDPRHG